MGHSVRIQLSNNGQLEYVCDTRSIFFKWINAGFNLEFSF